jgi:hypothetical protein
MFVRSGLLGLILLVNTQLLSSVLAREYPARFLQFSPGLWGILRCCLWLENTGIMRATFVVADAITHVTAHICTHTHTLGHSPVQVAYEAALTRSPECPNLQLLGTELEQEQVQGQVQGQMQVQGQGLSSPRDESFLLRLTTYASVAVLATCFGFTVFSVGAGYRCVCYVY